MPSTVLVLEILQGTKQRLKKKKNPVLLKLILAETSGKRGGADRAAPGRSRKEFRLLLWAKRKDSGWFETKGSLIFHFTN